MLDVDTINQMNNEQYHQEHEERQLKNHILNMTSTEKKQELWRKHFPAVDYQETDLIF